MRTTLVLFLGALLMVTCGNLLGATLASARTMTIAVQDQGADPDVTTYVAKQLGANSIRVVVGIGDPETSLVAKYHAAGMRVQAAIVVKRQTTSQDILSLVRKWGGMVDTVSVGNEPELNGVSACAYARLFARVQPRLKRMGLTVGFGEFSPAMPFEYIDQIARCHVRIRADFTAVHPYQFFSDPMAAPSERSGIGTWLGLGNLRRFAGSLRRDGLPSKLRATEFSYLTSGPYKISPDRAASYWPRAIKQAQRWTDQLVIYGLGQVHDQSTWGSASLLDRFGRGTDAMRALARALGRSWVDSVSPLAPAGDLTTSLPDGNEQRPVPVVPRVYPDAVNPDKTDKAVGASSDPPIVAPPADAGSDRNSDVGDAPVLPTPAPDGPATTTDGPVVAAPGPISEEAT